jgi:hypothetical protein
MGMRMMGNRVQALFLFSLLIPITVVAGPLVRIVAADSIAYENVSLPERGIETLETPTRKAAFQVWRNGTTARPLTVYYWVGGTASNGVDYARLAGRITIPRGSRFARIIVHPIDDTEVEQRTVGSTTVANETVVLTLRPSIAYDVGIRQARAIIVDDDSFTPIGVFPWRGERYAEGRAGQQRLFEIPHWSYDRPATGNTGAAPGWVAPITDGRATASP